MLAAAVRIQYDIRTFMVVASLSRLLLSFRHTSTLARIFAILSGLKTYLLKNFQRSSDLLLYSPSLQGKSWKITWRQCPPLLLS